MKKVAIAIGVFILLGVIYTFFQYGTISAVDDISGCYFFKKDNFSDKVCLLKSGEYEQISTIGGEENKYNQSEWKSFPYSDDEGDHIAATLKNFVLLDLNGEIQFRRDLDIQPHKNTFQKAVFAIGGNESRDRRTYFKQ